MFSKLTKFSGLYYRCTSLLAHFLLTVVLVGLSTLSVAQTEPSHNVARVELKSGLTLEGKVLHIEYQKHVDLYVNQSDTMHIPWDDILTISFIDSEIKQRAKAMAKTKRAEVPFRDSSNYFLLDFAVPLGLDYWGYPVAGGSINIGYGRGFGYSHHVAATLGYEFYLWPEVSVMPLGVEYYGRFKEKGRSWFYYYGTGYGFPHLSEYSWRENSSVSGGWYFNPGFGITNKRHEKRSWYLKFGYKYQKLHAEYDGYIWEFGSGRYAQIKEDIFYHRFDLRFGFRFD